MRRRSDYASPREQHNRGERRRTWRDPGLDGGERCLGKFSDDSCTADPRGLAVNPSAAVTIRGAEVQESGGRFSAKLHEFSGALEQCRQRSATVSWLHAADQPRCEGREPG